MMQPYLQGLLEDIKEWNDNGKTPLFSFIIDSRDFSEMKEVLEKGGLTIVETISYMFGCMCALVIGKKNDITILAEDQISLKDKNFISH